MIKSNNDVKLPDVKTFWCKDLIQTKISIKSVDVKDKTYIKIHIEYFHHSRDCVYVT